MKAVSLWIFRLIFAVAVLSFLLANAGAQYLQEHCEELTDAPGICRVVEISGVGQ